ncbi:polyprenol phosphomannose-dependent alpha 1,6 mannosyltransferase MptB [Catenuloplanes sp. NPDC051500]|uniref:polyprenol phosphomannose-dependent alpha 1,6 mannosyltransferase MptB n=1 Tax=Catenuloplanes sp. NPDC051500 TaxID=3363959 RepID=UPI00379889B3
MRLLGFLSSAMLAGGAWWAGALPSGHRSGPPGPYLAGLIVCLIGLAGLIVCWLRLARALPPLRSLLVTGALWQLPFLFAPPLGSRDVYSYACQGWVYTHGLDPYLTSPRAAGCPWLPGVADLWQDATTPYGPFALLISGIAGLSGSWLVALAVLRACALVGVTLAGVGVWQLASSVGAVGGDARLAVWLGLPAPLIAVHAVSGAHHDALLAGLVVVALGWALRGSSGFLVAAGVALGLAAAIKITALAVIPFVLILALREPRRPAAAQRGPRGPLLVTGGLAGSFGLVTLVSGLGFGWLGALTSSTGPKQWTSVPTGVGMALGYLLRAAGLGAHEEAALTVSRLGGVVALAALGLVCLWGAWRRRDDPRAVVLRAGVLLLAVVLLGPVAYPWYFLTPFPVLAAAMTSDRQLRWLSYGGAAASLLVLPDGLGIPAVTKAPGAIADLLLVIVIVVVGIRRLRQTRRTPVAGDSGALR